MSVLHVVIYEFHDDLTRMKIVLLLTKSITGIFGNEGDITPLLLTAVWPGFKLILDF